MWGNYSYLKTFPHVITQRLKKNDWKMWGNYFYLKKFPHVISYKGISTSFVTVNNK